jgi:SAM-dependent methyltransferase
VRGHPAVEELSQCTIARVRDSWTRATKPWSDFVRNGHDVHRELLHGPALLEACGDVGDARVLDVGCGEGWCSRQLAGRGARVVAVDVCEAMVAEACAHPWQASLKVDYRVMDAVDLHRHDWAGPFELATACMSLQSMPDPGGALKAIRQVLATDGRLVCSIPHPFTHMLGGRQCVRGEDGKLYLRAEDYFRTGPYQAPWSVPGAGEEWSTIRWSRPLNEYMRLFKTAGFVIRDQSEPRAARSDILQQDRLSKAGQLPYYLVFVAEPSRR